MEDFVIYDGVDLQRGEPGIPCCCNEEQESSCVISVNSWSCQGTRLREVRTCEGQPYPHLDGRFMKRRGRVSFPKASFVE